MKKQAKITQYLILSSLILLGCNKTYIENKYRIKSFSAESIDNQFTKIYFDLEYYTDSTYANKYSSAIEKGLDGSDMKILFFGSKNSSPDDTLNYKKLTYHNFIKKFNMLDKEMLGQKLEKGVDICFGKNISVADLVLVLKDKNGVIDTLQTKK